ncbi:hypothetical protein [Pontibacterium sp.]|uniref:hypothetical protein n=1 Tax=Pontibacterium sp. TaxID=2036026 RepID=UPI0035159CA5
MAKQSALKFKQLFALVVASAFAAAAVFMGVSMYGDLNAEGAASTAMVVFKAVSVGVSILFCAANAKMAMLAREERMSAEAA